MFLLKLYLKGSQAEKYILCSIVCVCVCERERKNMRNCNLIIAHLKAGRMRSIFTAQWYRGQGPSGGISTLSDRVQMTASFII